MDQLKDKSKSTLTENKVVLLRSLLISVLNKINSSIYNLHSIIIYSKFELFLIYIFIKGGINNLKFSLFYELLVYFFENDVSNSNKILCDLSSFFLNNIINDHNYCCDIEKKCWLYLINVYTEKFLDHQLDLPSMDPIISIKCLRMILNKSYIYVGSFVQSKLFSFFNLAVLNLK